MRVLSSYEMSLVAGGSGSTTVQWGSGPGEGGDDGSFAEVPASTVPSFRQNIAAEISQFFNEMSQAASGVQGDQGSHYPEGGNSAPLSDWFTGQFGSTHGGEPIPGADYWDFLNAGMDSEVFGFYLEDGTEINAHYSGGNISMAAGPTSTDPFSFSVNGTSVYGIWHPGASPPSADGANIIVNGGYWTLTFGAGTYTGSSYLSEINWSGLPHQQALPVDNYPSNWNYQRDYNIDKYAAQVANIIDNMPNSKTHEYRAFIYQTSDGDLHTSTIVGGTETGVQAGWAAYGIPSGATLIADVHNHPAYLPGGIWNADAIGTDYTDISSLQSIASGISPDGRPYPYVADSQYRMYITSSGYVSEYDAVHNTAPVPGTGPTYYPGAVRSGFYPDLGQ